MLQIIQQPDKVFYKCSSKNNTLNCIVKLISNKEGLKYLFLIYIRFILFYF